MRLNLQNLPTFLSSPSGIRILLIFVNRICLNVESLLSLSMSDFLLKIYYHKTSEALNTIPLESCSVEAINFMAATSWASPYELSDVSFAI